MKKINFIFCVHNHQPVGNFEFVLEKAYGDAYWPFLELLARHPSVKLVLHNSGALLEWIERVHPEYLELVRLLAGRGQLEVMTGGFYEPVLPSVPDGDKAGQIEKLSSFLREKLNVVPRGLWLAERVWEPSLASALARAGVEYTVVDDSHFKSAGLSDAELLGHYLTEDQGETIKIFSGSKRMRYLVPFAEPEETICHLRDRASEEGRNLVVFADDGEKFGVWPGTRALCYEKKWLERFLNALEANSEWLNVVTFSEYTAQNRPLGWVFLPTASYAEMMEWCLPVDAQLAYNEFLGKLKAGGEFEKYESFVKGGIWRNFLSRYPESNWMHKRMLFARRAIGQKASLGAGEVDRKSLDAALNEIWRAQCNCAYWHGVFGGLYLPHLREAIYRHIIRAERTLLEAAGGPGTCCEIVRADIDGDGEREIILSAGDVAYYLCPAKGGTLVELDHRRREVNLINTLARRREAYHSRIGNADVGPSADKAASIHDAVASKEEGLERFLFFDRFPRAALLDHFLPEDTSLERMAESGFDELGTFVEAPYEELDETGAGRVILRATGSVRVGRRDVRVTIEKTFAISAGQECLAVSYALEFERELEFPIMFASELNFHFSSPSDVECSVCGSSENRNISLARRGEFSGVEEIRIEDHNFGIEAVIRAEGARKLWQFPVETVSLSESGLERVYQATCIVPVWQLNPGLRKKEINLFIKPSTASSPPP